MNSYSYRSSIIVVTFNSAATIEDCLLSILLSGVSSSEIIFIDNASRDNTLDVIKDLIENASEKHGVRVPTEFRYTVTSLEQNVGFSKACNIGAKKAEGENLIFLNPDVMVFPGWIDRLDARLDHDKVVAVGPISNHVSGIQNYEIWLPQEFLAQESMQIESIAKKVYETNYSQTAETKSLSGFCLLIPKSEFEVIGGFDEDLFLGNDDLEFSWRLRLHIKKMAIALDTFIFHVGGSSFGTEPSIKSAFYAGQSAYILGEKLIRHYGVDKIPDPQDLWQNPIFPLREVLEPMTLMLLRDDHEIFNIRNVEKFKDMIPFRYDPVFIGYSESEVYEIRNIFTDNKTPRYFKNIQSYFKNVSPFEVEKGIEEKHADYEYGQDIFLSADSVSPIKYLVSNLRAARDACSADVVIPIEVNVINENRLLCGEFTDLMSANGKSFYISRRAVKKIQKEISALPEELDPFKAIQLSMAGLNIVRSKDAEIIKVKGE